MGFELIALVPIGIWIYMKFRQGKLVTATAKAMEATGRMFHGQIPGKPKILIIVAVDSSGTILDARLIQLMKLIKPATAYDLPEIVGKSLATIAPSKMTNDIETREAMNILIQSYLDATRGERKEKRILYVQSKRAIQRPNLKK